MNLNKINVLNHELSNFRNKITRLEEELESINNNDVCEYDQLCDTLTMYLSPSMADIEYLYNEMQKIEKSGVKGLYVKFDTEYEEDYSGDIDEYTKARIYGDKKYAQEKLDKRKVDIESEIESYNKRIEKYKEELKLEVLREN